MPFINIGFGNTVSSERVVAISSPDSSPIKRLASEAKEAGRVIDVTSGHKTKAVIVTDTDYVILSALSVEKISDRMNGKQDSDKEEEQS